MKVESFAGANFQERSLSKLSFAVINFGEWLGKEVIVVVVSFIMNAHKMWTSVRRAIAITMVQGSSPPRELVVAVLSP